MRTKCRNRRRLGGDHMAEWHSGLSLPNHPDGRPSTRKGRSCGWPAIAHPAKRCIRKRFHHRDGRPSLGCCFRSPYGADFWPRRANVNPITSLRPVQRQCCELLRRSDRAVRLAKPNMDLWFSPARTGPCNRGMAGAILSACLRSRLAADGSRPTRHASENAKLEKSHRDDQRWCCRC